MRNTIQFFYGQFLLKTKWLFLRISKTKLHQWIILSSIMLFVLSRLSLSKGTDNPQNKPKDNASYILGHTIGKMIAHTGVSFKNLKIDDFILGIEESFEGKPLSLSEEDTLKAYQTIRLRGEENKNSSDNKLEKKAKQYILDLASKPNINKLPSGAFYEILNEGSGTSPKSDQVVSYSWLTRRMDGTLIDSSDVRKMTATFNLTESSKSSKDVKPTTEAIAKEVFPRMKKGSKWKIIVPPELAYGNKGNPPFIRPHEVLFLEIEVLQISDKPK